MHFLEEFPFVKLGTVQKRNMEASKTKLVLVWVCNDSCVSIPSSAGPGGKVTYTQPRESK